MERRDFLHLSGFAAGALVVPVWGRPVNDWTGALTPIPTTMKRPIPPLWFFGLFVLSVGYLWREGRRSAV